MIIVTGAAGFIGSAFIWQLNNLGRQDIIACDHFRGGNKWLNLRDLVYEDFVLPDELFDFVREKSLDIEAIVHLGACSSTTEQDMDYLYENNYRYSKDIYQLAKETKAKLIYASSGATYGDRTELFDDNLSPNSLSPLNKYGYSKNMFDMWVERRQEEVDVVGLKFFNVFGPNEYHKGSMASVLFHNYHHYTNTQRCKLFASKNPDYLDGHQKRDFIYIKDVLRVMELFLKRKVSRGLYNVGTGRAESFYDFIKPIFNSVSEDKAPLDYIDMPKDLEKRYQYFTKADMTKTFKALDIDESFFMSIEDSVNDYLDNYLTQNSPSESGMNELEDIVEILTEFIESSREVKLQIANEELKKVIIEDVFISDGTLKLQYSHNHNIYQVDLVQLKQIDDLSIYDLLGIEGSTQEPSLFQDSQWLNIEKETNNPFVDTNEYSVKSLTNYLKTMIESDINLKDIYIKAEMINVSYSSQGHLYFSLKEETTSIKCIFFNAVRIQGSHRFKNGEYIEVLGDVKLYDKLGVYQIVVNKMVAIGDGDLYGQYQLLKKELKLKGFFDIEKKKIIPLYPKKVAIITSDKGAAIEDVLKVLGDNTYFDVIIYPCLVQGKIAVDDIVNNIELVNQREDIDILLLTRGGGSIEDLWAFNEKEVVEAIYDSRIPVITAIGHEVDTSLSDEVSDYALPTPTAAAYYLIEKYNKLKIDLEHFRYQLSFLYDKYLDNLVYKVQDMRQSLINLGEKKVYDFERRIELLKTKISSFSPIKILERGFVIVSTKDNKQIKSLREFRQVKEEVILMFHDGEAHVKMKKGDE